MPRHTILRETDDGAASSPPPTASAASSRPLEELPGDATTAYHRGRLFALLALGFDRPGERLVRAVDDDAFNTSLVPSAAALDDELATLAHAVAERVDDASVHHATWASLFGVEEGVAVSPYELTYLPGPLLTNVRRLADLNGFYEAFDLEVAPGKHDRRDHLCFQLEFLAQLAYREAYLRLGDDDGVAVVVDAHRRFLEDHLGRWYWRFADEVSQRDDGLYAALADLLAALVEVELDHHDLDPDWVPDDPSVADWTEDIFGEDVGRGCGPCGITPDPTAAPDGPHHTREGGNP